LVSGTYFPVLGVDAVLGRTLTPEDDTVAGAHPLAVISYGYWKRRLTLDPQVLGKTFAANQTIFTIVGVAPPGFFGETVGEAPDMWLPLAMKDQLESDDTTLNSANTFWLDILGRLKPDISPARAAAAMTVLLKEVNGETMGPKAGRMELRAQVKPASKGLDVLRQRFFHPLRILMAVVGLVLLVACVSVASLLTARAVARQKEIAVRVTLGASNRRLVQQLLTESILLASMSGLLGLLLTWWMGRALTAFLFDRDVALNLGLNNQVLLFTIVVSILTGTVFGLAPAVQVLRSNLVNSLKDDPVGSGGLKRGLGFRRALVVAQIALCMLLVMTAGLFVRSLQKLNNIDPGFNKENLLLVTMEPQAGVDSAHLKSIFQEVLDKCRDLPGVRSCSVSLGSFGDGAITMGPMVAEGYIPKPGEDATLEADVISPGFFTTMGIPVLLGRDFRPQDDSAIPKVVIINETLARYYFGNSSPLGKHLGWGRIDRRPLEIVGVVKDSKYGNLGEQTPRFFYLPFLQQADSFAGVIRLLEVRTMADPGMVAAEVRDKVNSTTSSLQVQKINTMMIQVQDSLRQQSMLARLASSFGLFALLLASMGLYGIMSHAVTRRTNEIGIRMALGAQRSQILWMMLREALLLVAVGMIVGIPAALACTRLASSLISGLVFGVKAIEPNVILASVLILGLVALLAGYAPARRAAQISPLQAIRHE
jgi:predicted permease